jgi:uncharacterized membrane protein YbhN (UPF0104 family)
MTAPVARRRRSWGRWLLVLLGAVLLVVVVNQLLSAGGVALDPSKADWRWVGVAVVAQAVFFLLYGGLYRYGFRSVGVTSGALRLVPVLLASIFAKTALPLTAAPAAAVFIDDATSRGESGAATAVGIVVVLVLDLLTALPFVAVGAVALILRAKLVAFALIGTGLFVLFIGTLLVVLVLAAMASSLLEALLRAVRVAVNLAARLIRRPALLPESWPRHNADQLVAAANSIPRRPGDIAIASGYGLALHAANLVGLAALFLAFGQNLDVAPLVAGFGMSIVFFVITIVPDGIGAVEGGMALVFVQLGMGPGPAILVTLAYRVLNVWIPVVIGFWFARRLRLFGAASLARQRAVAAEPEDVVEVTKS